MSEIDKKKKKKTLWYESFPSSDLKSNHMGVDPT
jgi:hypothetical protein